MGRSDQLMITVVEADLVRIFDKVMRKQDVYAQLVSTYDDGTQNVVGRTQICKEGNMKPRWSESFTYNRGRALNLTFQVIADRSWRGEVLCGEAVIDMASLWSRAFGGAPVLLPLVKNEGQTGVLHLNVGPYVPQGGRSRSAPHAAKRSSSAASSSSSRSGRHRSRRSLDEVPVVGTGCRPGCLVPMLRGRSSRDSSDDEDPPAGAHRRAASTGATVRGHGHEYPGAANTNSWWNSFIQRG
mmetsp:Transcript_11168/g.20304  ORF Transcript_11168/g.20304 Transcript_11168/m.20304 type:complete len:241 (-) Transcript_11168:328-1050(-)